MSMHESRARRGFTLVELLLVVTILGILAAIVVVNFTHKGTDARIAATRVSIANVCTAVGTFEATKSRLPESLDELTADAPNSPALLKKASLNDAWGQPIQYKLIDKSHYEVRSAGEDEQLGTADDLLNPN